MKEAGLANRKIGILGTGNMGQAIARGLKKLHPEIPLYGYEKDQNNRVSYIEYSDSIALLEEKSEIVILCVKPTDLKGIVKSLSGNKNYISIAAGVSTDRIKEWARKDSLSIARVMPNLSAAIGESVSGIYCEDENLKESALAIFSAIGMALSVPREELMHAVTGLSGSGPAYVFAFIQSLAEGGVLNGLSYNDSLKLAAHTVMSAAKMVIETGEHPHVMRNRVTSPGGTTIHGLKELEDGGLPATVMAAVEAATERSREMGD